MAKIRREVDGLQKCIRCAGSSLVERFDQAVLGGLRRPLHCTVHDQDVNSADTCDEFRPLWPAKIQKKRGKT